MSATSAQKTSAGLHGMRGGARRRHRAIATPNTPARQSSRSATVPGKGRTNRSAMKGNSFTIRNPEDPDREPAYERSFSRRPRGTRRFLPPGAASFHRPQVKPQAVRRENEREVLFVFACRQHKKPLRDQRKGERFAEIEPSADDAKAPVGIEIRVLRVFGEIIHRIESEVPDMSRVLVGIQARKMWCG